MTLRWFDCKIKLLQLYWPVSLPLSPSLCLFPCILSHSNAYAALCCSALLPETFNATVSSAVLNFSAFTKSHRRGAGWFQSWGSWRHLDEPSLSCIVVRTEWNVSITRRKLSAFSSLNNGDESSHNLVDVSLNLKKNPYISWGIDFKNEGLI